MLDGKRTVQAKTSEKGYFEIDQSTKLSFGMESHKLANIFFIEKNGFQTDTLEVYGGINDVFKKDSIFMKSLSIQIR